MRRDSHLCVEDSPQYAEDSRRRCAEDNPQFEECIPLFGAQGSYLSSAEQDIHQIAVAGLGRLADSKVLFFDNEAVDRCRVEEVGNGACGNGVDSRLSAAVADKAVSVEDAEEAARIFGEAHASLHAQQEEESFLFQVLALVFFLQEQTEEEQQPPLFQGQLQKETLKCVQRHLLRLPVLRLFSF